MSNLNEIRVTGFGHNNGKKIIAFARRAFSTIGPVRHLRVIQYPPRPDSLNGSAVLFVRYYYGEDEEEVFNLRTVTYNDKDLPMDRPAYMPREFINRQELDIPLTATQITTAGKRWGCFRVVDDWSAEASKQFNQAERMIRARRRFEEEYEERLKQRDCPEPKSCILRTRSCPDLTTNTVAQDTMPPS